MTSQNQTFSQIIESLTELTQSEREILSILVSYKGMTLEDLTRHTNYSHIEIVQILKSLQRKGLIQSKSEKWSGEVS
jgi:predicted transcriptional regulator